jgi:preprotein translocase subunit SecA
MFQSFANKLFGTKHQRTLKKMQLLLDQIEALEPRFAEMDDDALAGMTPVFKERLTKGETLDQLLPEAFAVCREAAKRVTGMRHYRVQLVGGIVMHRGDIAEMRTGEGKTLTATLALYLNALEGKGAHLVTVNEYLAARDAEWMGEIYGFLGMRTGVIVPGLTAAQRQAAYAADITYATNSELGFDYLRDNQVFNLASESQRTLHYAIVDEVDSILIDEARTPLIISSQADLNVQIYKDINELVIGLLRDEDYQVNEEHRSVSLSDEGVNKVEERLGLDNLYDVTNIQIVHHVQKALEANTLYLKGQEYLVKDGKCLIIDKNTGRTMDGRRWSDGLHQAVEAKEGVDIKPESTTSATITYQNFFRMYAKLSGMTGTADTEAEELNKTYGLDVVVIPTNRPIARLDNDDLVYRTESEKFAAIVDEIIACHEKGQPVLVGTVSVDKSEVISKVLRKNEIAHSVLNAKFHGKEAHIIAQAGRKGGITIATNMAGRGTDILLGGNPEAMAAEVAEQGTKEFDIALERFREKCIAEKKEVLAAGGLFILGTERHESRRIDNQLRGRAGRQGDPGESKFFLSLEDDLMRRFGADRIQGLMQRLGMEAGVPIEAGMVNRSIENAQAKVEGRNADIRKHLLEYDDVMDVQRKTIYTLRKQIIEGENMQELVLDLLEDALKVELDIFVNPDVRREDWDFMALAEAFKTRFDLEIEAPASLPLNRRQVEDRLWGQIEAHMTTRVDELQVIADDYEANDKVVSERNEQIRQAYMKACEDADTTGEQRPEEPEVTDPPGNKSKEEIFNDVAQNCYLNTLDSAWRDHLNAMRMLRDSVSLQGYAQKDPKQIYKKEGFDLFAKLQGRIYGEVAHKLCRLVVPTADQVGTDALKDKWIIRSQRMRQEQEERLRQRMRDQQAAQKAAAAAQRASQPGARPTRRVTMSPPVGLGAAAAGVAAGKAAPALPRLGRNDLCWCGSSKKYKHCHMRVDRERASETGESRQTTGSNPAATSGSPPAVATGSNTAVSAGAPMAVTGAAAAEEEKKKKKGGISLV